MLAETPVTPRSPCYSAVSSSLMNPLPDCSNYSPFCHTHYLTPDQYFCSLFGPDPLPSRSAGEYLPHCCSALLQNLVGNSCLWGTKQQAEASGDVPPPPLQIVISIPFCLFLISLYLYPLSAPFLNSLSILSLIPFFISPSLSTIPSFSSDQFSVLLR